jgi:hypothetical protein
MNLTLHLVLNDIRRMRVWLIGWTVVLLLPLAIGCVILTREPSSAAEWNLPDKVTILTFLQVLVGYMLSLILLHEHPIVGTNQFWLTRPISRGRLLSAKAIGLFLMVGLLPVIVSLPWWLWCGFNAGQLFNAAAETILVMMLITLAAALMAVLTDSFPRALLWTVVMVAVLLFGMLYFTIVNVATFPSAHQFSLVISRSIVAVVVLAMVMLTVVVAQFFFRRRGGWLAAAGGLAVVLVLAAFRWPWGWVPIDPVEFNATLGDSVKLRFDRATAGPLPRERRPGQEVFQEVRSHFVVSGVPEGFDAQGSGVRHEWRSGAAVIRRAERDWWTSYPTDASEVQRTEVDPETERGHAETSNMRFNPPLVAGEAGLRVTSYLPPSIVARFQTEPPEYRARLWWQLGRGQSLFKMPMAASPRMTREGRGIRIARVERGPSHLEVTTVETRPVTIRSLLNEETSERAWYPRVAMTDAMLYQLHRERGEYLNMLVHDLDDPRRVIVNGVEITWRRRAPVGPLVIRNGKREYLRPAVDGDMLGVSIRKVEALISREVKVERLQITGK